LKRTERKYNDKAGIIFLFSLISVVFFMDIYIELSRINLTSDTDSKIEISSYPSDYFNDLLTNSETKKIDQAINFSTPVYAPDTKAHSSIKLSLLFFLLASFTFLYFGIIVSEFPKRKPKYFHIMFHLLTQVEPVIFHHDHRPNSFNFKR